MYIIHRIGKSETIIYAARELAKYLTLITGKDCFKIQEEIQYEPTKRGLWIGIQECFGINVDVEDKYLDDGITIQIAEGKGIIGGTNERSILLGVYRFLDELGCKWVRPGKNGEKLVRKDMKEMNVSLQEVASYRHRGVVIEGANSYENVVDMIEWMPKLGYNSYFIQFMHAYSFFKQWYAHTHNPLKQPEFFDDEMAMLFTEGITKEIKKRGLLFHAVGHGWTCEAIGIPGRGWDQEKHVLTEEQRGYLALIDGKRELFHQVPLNTNLCYSNPQAQEQFVGKIVQYAKEHKCVDMLHVWVADEYNNHCECEKCHTLTPTDWYVQILNQIDKRLSEEGVDTQIVFLLYFELLWTPIQERLHNPKRFIMMFAPISRTFIDSYEDMQVVGGNIERQELNKIKLPTGVSQYVQLLEEWQKVFKGDSFDFDYHLGRAHYGDPGYYKIAEVIYKDIRKLGDLGLNGLLSCQQQRTFFPTALPSYVMGRTLWNKSVIFEDLVEEYFKAAFGEGYEACIHYLESISQVFDMDYWHVARGGLDEVFAEKVLGAHKIVDTFEEVIARYQKHKHPVEALSWKYLTYHLEYTRLFAEALSAKARGEGDKANSKWSQFASYICKNEDTLQPVLDVYRLLMIAKIFMKFEIQDTIFDYIEKEFL